MKKLLCVTIAAAAIALLLAACPMVDEEPSPTEVNWVHFPDEEITRGIAFYGEGKYDAGGAKKLPDGSWEVTVKYEANPNVGWGKSVCSAFFAFGGPAVFKTDYSVTLELPAAPADKPKRIIVLPTPSLPTDNDPQAGADWGNGFDTSTDFDLPAGFDFTGELVASNQGREGNAPAIDKRTLDIWLFFDNTKTGVYTFKIKEAKAGDLDLNLVKAPVVTKALVTTSQGAASEITITPAIAGMTYYTEKNFSPASSLTNLEIDLVVPAAGVGKTVEFFVRPVLHDGEAKNVFNPPEGDELGLMRNAYIAGGTSAQQPDSVAASAGLTMPGYFKITAKMTQYDTIGGVANGTGAKLILPLESPVNALRYIVYLTFPADYKP
jgi:hypothetical protein